MSAAGKKMKKNLAAAITIVTVVGIILLLFTWLGNAHIGGFRNVASSYAKFSTNLMSSTSQSLLGYLETPFEQINLKEYDDEYIGFGKTAFSLGEISFGGYKTDAYLLFPDWKPNPEDCPQAIYFYCEVGQGLGEEQETAKLEQFVCDELGVTPSWEKYSRPGNYLIGFEVGIPDTNLALCVYASQFKSANAGFTIFRTDSEAYQRYRESRDRQSKLPGCIEPGCDRYRTHDCGYCNEHHYERLRSGIHCKGCDSCAECNTTQYGKWKP